MAVSTVAPTAARQCRRRRVLRGSRRSWWSFLATTRPRRSRPTTWVVRTRNAPACSPPSAGSASGTRRPSRAGSLSGRVAGRPGQPLLRHRIHLPVTSAVLVWIQYRRRVRRPRDHCDRPGARRTLASSAGPAPPERLLPRLASVDAGSPRPAIYQAPVLGAVERGRRCQAVVVGWARAGPRLSPDPDVAHLGSCPGWARRWRRGSRRAGPTREATAHGGLWAGSALVLRAAQIGLPSIGAGVRSR